MQVHRATVALRLPAVGRFFVLDDNHAPIEIDVVPFQETKLIATKRRVPKPGEYRTPAHVGFFALLNNGVHFLRQEKPFAAMSFFQARQFDALAWILDYPRLSALHDRKLGY